MKTLFLDLEKTIIESVDNPIFLNDNIEKIFNLFQKEKFDKVLIFSFAIHEKEDIEPIKFVIEEISDIFNRIISVIPKNSLLDSFRNIFFESLTLMNFHDFSELLRG